MKNVSLHIQTTARVKRRNTTKHNQTVQSRWRCFVWTERRRSQSGSESHQLLAGSMADVCQQGALGSDDLWHEREWRSLQPADARLVQLAGVTRESQPSLERLRRQSRVVFVGPVLNHTCVRRSPASLPPLSTKPSVSPRRSSTDPRLFSSWGRFSHRRNSAPAGRVRRPFP